MSRSRVNAAAVCWIVCLSLFLAYCGTALSSPNCDVVCRETDCRWIGGGQNTCRTFEFRQCNPCVIMGCADTKLPGTGSCTGQGYDNWYSDTGTGCAGTCPPPPGFTSHDADVCADPFNFDLIGDEVKQCR
jgi:hypothetical protein